MVCGGLFFGVASLDHLSDPAYLSSNNLLLLLRIVLLLPILH